VKNTKPPAAGRGRPKGAPNKTTAAIKEMIENALAKAGGVDYLVTQAATNPAAFLTLVGKVLPLQVTGSGDNGEHVAIIKMIGVRADGG
jgi:hypothetical protein